MSNLLRDADEILFRQIHPKMLDKGEPASDRFRPSAQDNGKLSVDRSALCSAAASHAAYTATGLQSAAVFGLLVGEFNGENIPCLSDPIGQSDGVAANPAHALADYTAIDAKNYKNIAKRLKMLAVARGCLHPIE